MSNDQTNIAETKRQSSSARRTNALLKSCAAACVGGLLVGCDTKGWFAPNEISVRSGAHPESLVVPILTNFDPSVEKGPNDYPNATLPKPSDLVSNTNDYAIGHNDVLQISISDLLAPGQETLKTARVSESGNISLPYLGSVHAAGLTEIELEQGIVQAYRDANLIQNSQVSVTVIEARGRTVEILGSVAQPGQYAILDSDFRLLDALVQAKDVTTPLIENIYVIRRSESQKTANTTSTTRPVPNIRNDTGAPTAPATTKPNIDDLAPHTDDGAVTERVAAVPQPNHPLNLVADAPAEKAPPAPIAAPAAPASVPSTHNFEFNAPAGNDVERVIRIPYAALRTGDLTYNIAIHPRDLIVVQPLPVGEFYMGGHVARPGPYTLTGRRITIKQAVVSAGMFDDLAIPQRTEIIRRVGADREVFVRVNLERIFAGETPDLYLKPNDQIMVGTNMLAPFLSAFRGAFRLTYGFGFLYDRNFAYTTNNNSF